MIDISYGYFQLMRRILGTTQPKYSVYGNRILDIEDGSRIIKDIIRSGNACMVGRIGSVEMQTINAVTAVQGGYRKNIADVYMDYLYNNAGFFPKEKDLIPEFAEIYRMSCHYLDVAAVLMNRDEDYFYHKYAGKIDYITLAALEPYFSSDPWTSELKNKRVLVIHPFSETITKQYQSNRIHLFADKDVLPEFNLITIKAIQTIGDNTEGYSCWFEALDEMKKRIDFVDFDIALLGCGAYAFPLAAYIKTKGKQAVILGGATQLLFGIKGKRFDQHPLISRLYNEYWIRPGESEKPEGYSAIEGGCYW